MGLGNVGLPVAQYISKIYPQTRGYGISQAAVVAARKVEVEASIELGYVVVYVIAVNPWYRGGCAVEDCVRRISKINSGGLVCFESVPVKGTARRGRSAAGIVWLMVLGFLMWFIVIDAVVDDAVV
jgi:hypothetical protein